MNYRVVEVRQNLLKKNEVLANELRSEYAAGGAFVTNLLSSPGSGKTTLLEETLRRLSPEFRVAALVGDQATDADAIRLARSGAPVRQISTGAECRLDAFMIKTALKGWNVSDYDALFIENVGNLICPAEYDLGEDLRVALFSVTEGEDKPLKYPLAFNTAHVVLITKIDIAEAVGFDAASARANIRQVSPEAKIIELSARNGGGMAAWLDLLLEHVRRKSSAHARVARG